MAFTSEDIQIELSREIYDKARAVSTRGGYGRTRIGQAAVPRLKPPAKEKRIPLEPLCGPKPSEGR